MSEPILDFMNHPAFNGGDWEKFFANNFLQHEGGYYIDIYGDIGLRLEHQIKYNITITLTPSQLRALADYRDYVNIVGEEFVALKLSLLSIKNTQAQLEKKLLELESKQEKN